MTERTTKAHGDGPTPGLPGFRAVVVPVDLTPISDRILGRVALLPLADAASVTLLHVVPRDLPARARDRARRAAAASLADEARRLASAVRRRVRIEPLVRVGAAAETIGADASGAAAEVIVLGRGGGRALRDVFLGSTAERVIRHAQVPVLAVRLAPRALYARPAVALDLDEPAAGVLAMMLRVLPAPRPRVAVIHACDTPYRGLAYGSWSEADAAELCAELTTSAARRLTRLCKAALARAHVPPEEAPRWRMHVRCGSPRLEIEKAVTKADTDLLGLGTHGRSGLAHVLLGTVAGDVLRTVACDVLVVPGPR